MTRADETPTNLQEIVLRTIRRTPASTVRGIYDIVKQTGHDLSEDEFVDEVKALAADKKLTLAVNLERGVTFQSFLAVWSANLWLYAAMILVALTLSIVYLLPSSYPVSFLRWTAGILFVCFLPGFVTLQALFPMGELEDSTKLIMSVVLSLVIIMAIGLLLNFSPWRIRLTPIMISLSAYTIIVGLAGARRKFEVLRRQLAPESNSTKIAT